LEKNAPNPVKKQSKKNSTETAKKQTNELQLKITAGFLKPVFFIDPWFSTSLLSLL
jgi:hypothetical protein